MKWKIQQTGVLILFQELRSSGDPKGPVRSREAGSSADGRNHPAVPDVGQTAASGGVPGQGGDTGHPHHPIMSRDST